MPKARATTQSEFVFDPGEANPKQKRFYEARTMFIGYGGAKGGGKTHAVRVKAALGAFTYPGIRVLILRKSYPELQSNHIEPMLGMLPPEVISYNGTLHTIYFENGSIIHFGHWSGDHSENEYNGQEYDWIFMDEATQFTWRTFQYLGGLLRGVNDIPKRFYVTCNPGGVGHRWVKRLFIDKQYISDPDNPEATENPKDYTFIPATVEDNTALMKSSPNYVKNLAQMPENIRKAYRYGDWDALGGNYFPEFSDALHVVPAFTIPRNWKRYRAFDYGLDMFACGWFAVDEEGRSYMYREFSAGDMIVQDAAAKMRELTLPNERIEITFAPPDIWSRQKDSGKTMAEIFLTNGIPIVRADNNRVQGHMLIKEALAPRADGIPSLLFLEGRCRETVSDIQDIQSDEKNPNDCAKDPHEVTHRVDMVRYYTISRVMSAEAEKQEAFRDEQDAESYEEFMTGGEATAGYMSYGGL